ncbi:OmpA family protein [Caulobacter sp. LjRoot300]|jgi:outer membrane protein OmpA-like peptidoglycan-associated protein|uniref:OmpA family protein n=1 Tax=Caulobacter sp. LjRoot300 TaxID=3342321 RepID=UPI003ECD46D5
MKTIGRAIIGVAVLGGLVAGCVSHPGPKSRSQVVQMAPSCEDFSVQIYFESRSAQLTNEARSVLKGADALATGCKVASVRVVGLADAVGAPDANLALSKQRADVVTRALDKMGYSNVTLDVGAAGDAGAMTNDGENRPLRRQADIRFDLDGRLR